MPTTLRLHDSVSNTISSTDSIPKGIQIHKFNRLIKNLKAKMLNFPGASSHQLLHYLDVHLKDKSIDTVIIHIGINDLLTNSSRSGMDNLIYHIKKITEKCLMLGVKSVFISGLMFLYLKESKFWFLISVGKIIYIDNRNIRSDSLYKDGLHLIDKGKAFLEDNFVVYLNNNIFSETHTHHPPKNIWVVILDKQLSFFRWEQNSIYCKRIGGNI